MRRLVLGALCFFAGSVTAAARVVSLAVEEPRTFGYFEADVLRREAVLTVTAGDRIDPASLPRPGPVNYWLELRSADLDVRSESSETQYRLRLEYQAFYSALDPRKLTIPGFTLRVTGAEGDAEARVPSWSFVVSPLRELFPGAQAEAPEAVALQPDAAPRLVSTDLARNAVLAAALAALASLVLLARHMAWWPFRAHQRRPFTEAARFLRSHAKHLAGAGGYRAAMLKLHRAFDLAAGRRVLPDDLAAFLGEHPEFAPMAGEIERAFASSREAFFGGDVDGARALMPVPELTQLVARLGEAERGAA